MKKYFTLACIALVITGSSFASTDTYAAHKSAAHLEANFASANDATWTYTDTYEKASINNGKEKLNVYYDVNGDLIGTTKTMDFDKLPKAALALLTSEYTFPDYQLTDCIQFTDADNNTRYFVSFDADGQTTLLSISTDGTISEN
ncbi:MAG TPA: hypothetical protein VG842_00265 [Sediminibacterium sp.]|nr:hypothetical protein [Sediminibacterium sp.]